MTRNIASVSALVILMAASFILVGYQGVPWFASAAHRTRITLVVADAAGLIPRSPVLLRGIRIGEVETVQSNAADVSVHLWYTEDVKVPGESIYRVENLSALGETYLSISPQRTGGPFLADNQRVIAEPNTVTGTIGEMAVAVNRLLGDLEPARVNRVVDELDTALSDTAGVPDLAGFSRRINETVGGNRQTIKDILTNVQTLIKYGQGVAPALEEIPAPLLKMSGSLANTAAGMLILVYFTPGLSLPNDLRDGALVTLNRIIKFEDDIATNVYNLATPLLPAIQATAGALSGLDTSRLLDATMSSLETPGSFTVHVIPSR